MPTCTRAARARWRASASLTLRCACTVSIIWVSTRRTGLRVIIGSWKIIAISAPRIARIRSGDAAVSSSPLNLIELPSTMRPGGSISPRIEKPVTVLPEPDSPTRPRISPGATSKSTPSTALATPSLVKKWVRRSQTLSVFIAGRSSQIPRVQHVAQVIAREVDADDGDGQRHAREEADPVAARQQELEAVGDQHAERRLGHRHADAEEGERRLERDRARQGDGGDHDQQRHAVGQHVTEDDAPRRQGEAGRSL